jgi:hypothetical protein
MQSAKNPDSSLHRHIGRLDRAVSGLARLPAAFDFVGEHLCLETGEANPACGMRVAGKKADAAANRQVVLIKC